MNYFGGKQRIAGQLAPFIQSRLASGQAFVDLFCGATNVVSRIRADTRIANDACAPLIALHRAVQGGWQPPTTVTEDEYRAARSLPDDDPRKAFIGFGCSFSGKWFGGYARNKTERNYAANARNSLLKKHANLRDVVFTAGDYRDVVLPDRSLVYCDIPYRGTTAYGATGAFDHEAFYKWASAARQAGHDVLVSEYAANVPDGWQVVWSVDSKQDIRSADGLRKLTTEVLMVPA